MLGMRLNFTYDWKNDLLKIEHDCYELFERIEYAVTSLHGVVASVNTQAQ